MWFCKSQLGCTYITEGRKEEIERRTTWTKADQITAMCLKHTYTKNVILVHWYIQYSHVYKSLWSKLGRFDADWLAALHLARLTNAAPGFQIFK